jgi:ribonuclease HI
VKDLAKSKFYVVWVGHESGVYRTWTECLAQTQGFPLAKFKSYETEAEAAEAYAQGWKKSLNTGKQKESAGNGKGRTAAADNSHFGTELSGVDYDSLSVDVGCSGNPGIVEYKGVDTRTGEILFYHGPISKGTNNMGEFLAIVHALGYLKQRGSSKTIYTDSVTALSWLRNKRVASNLVRDASTEEIWTLVDRAIKWLQTNSYPNRIAKWDTKRWGEIKADFGRK